MRYQRYLTIVYAVPPGWDVSPLTGHEYAKAIAWSHKMDDCNGLLADNEKLAHRGDALAATIRALQEVVTHDAETKQEFIARVRAILSAEPDGRLARFYDYRTPEQLKVLQVAENARIRRILDSPEKRS